MKTQIAKLYHSWCGQDAPAIRLLPGAGSKRKYYRIEPTGTQPGIVGAIGTNRDENRAFVALARKMASEGLAVPQIYAVADDVSSYLQQDLGDTSLYDLIAQAHKSGEWNQTLQNLLHKVMQNLPDLQFLTARGFDFDIAYPISSFTPESIFWDLNYFKYCFLKVTGIELDEPGLEGEFRLLEQQLSACFDTDTFMYRDFQSRNIMIHEGQPYYIDFQGGRRGPIYYDVASFLWQARAAYPEWLRESLLQTYLQHLQPYYNISEPTFRNRLHLFVFFRLLQVLGAYGFLGLVEHKAMFMTSISQALHALGQLIKDYQYQNDFPTLCRAVHEVADQPRFQASQSNGRLVVKVQSFSYKKGIPEDYSGNGGGFVFDCRATHNPGRYEPYKHLTGLDAPVKEFLEQDGEILTFLEHVDAIVDATVERYLQRGFTSLMVCFGCTGGQHRSVYSAQHVAERLSARYDVTIELTHREQGIEQVWNSKP